MYSKQVPFEATKITGAFWRERYETVKDVTMQAVLDRYVESGRIEALKMEWQEGDPNKPHIFWESDVTKWMEGVAYYIEQNSMPEWEEKLDELIDVMARTQDDNGYLNTYFTVVEPDARFTRRVDHELYCAGHLIEAAVAYAEATGKTKLLDVARKYADLIDDRFRIKRDTAFDTCGHQEIELALFKLYDYTGENRYKLLAEFFLDMRGHSEKDVTYVGYDDAHLQSHLPIREQTTAEGHSVRALYMFIAVADMALLNDDKELILLCQTFFRNIIDRRMYITGGVGSTHLGESFTYDYDLPSDTAYTETCASIALALFCRRMWLLDPNGIYGDIAEQAIYNTVMGGLSLGGDRFYYENPLSANAENHSFYEHRPQHLAKHLPILERAKAFSCSCCPPNLVRFVGSIADFMYTTAGDTVYAQCYMDAETTLILDNKTNGIDDKTIEPVDKTIERDAKTIDLKQRTEYPYDGRIEITVGVDEHFELALRIPGWCRDYSVMVNEDIVQTEVVDGFVRVRRDYIKGDQIILRLEMKPRLIEANPKVKDLDGKVALMRGPIVYCAEAVDNPGLNIFDLKLDPLADMKLEEIVIEGRTVPSIVTTAKFRQTRHTLYTDYPIQEELHQVRLIPYFAWANRGKNDMTCWMRG